MDLAPNIYFFEVLVDFYLNLQGSLVYLYEFSNY